MALTTLMFILMIVICMFTGLLLAIPLVLFYFWVKSKFIKKKIIKLIERKVYKLKDERDKDDEQRYNTGTDTENRVREPIFKGKVTIEQLERKYEGKGLIQNVHDRKAGSTEPVINDPKRELTSLDRKDKARFKLYKPTII